MNEKERYAILAQGCRKGGFVDNHSLGVAMGEENYIMLGGRNIDVLNND